VLDSFTGNNVESLIANIRELLYHPPEKIAIVLEDGNVKIKNKNDDIIAEEGQVLNTQGDESELQIEQFKSIDHGAMDEENLLV